MTTSSAPARRARFSYISSPTRTTSRTEGPQLRAHDRGLDVGRGVVDGGDDGLGLVDAGLREHGLAPGVADHRQRLRRQALQFLLVTLYHDDRLARLGQPFGDGPAEHPEAADDDVVAQVLDASVSLHAFQFLHDPAAEGRVQYRLAGPDARQEQPSEHGEGVGLDQLLRAGVSLEVELDAGRVEQPEGRIDGAYAGEGDEAHDAGDGDGHERPDREQRRSQAGGESTDHDTC